MITKQKHIAFTLAETLLTLIVIGVIASLTVLALKEHSDEAKYVSLTKKAMSEIASATSAIETDHGDVQMWNFGSTTTANWYKNVMNVVSNPGVTNWDRNNLNGTFNSQFVPTFTTADGMAWAIGTGGYPCGGGCALVDVNGPEPPNVIGVDQHGFRIGGLCKQVEDADGNKKQVRDGNFGIYPMGDGVNDSNGAWACTAYVIKHQKMPWLKGGYTKCDGLVGK